MKGEANAVHHVPCGLLSDAEIAGHFITADPVLAIHDQPNGGQPLVERQRGVLEDGSGFQGELGAGMLAIALPHSRFRKIAHVIRAALWATHDAIGPAKLHHELFAVLEVGKVYNCLLKGLGFGVHESSMAEDLWSVKLVVTQNCSGRRARAKS